ncbi:MAG: sulfurtransferase TusA family protein [Kangiellaceae bacterium]|nr:sulfurtransferase TusA family protein [Kangiellaceae bacterium]
MKNLNLNVRNLRCPMPLLKLKQALNSIEKGDIVHLIATDRASIRDISAFIKISRNTLSYQEIDNEIHFCVVKGPSDIQTANKN